MSGEVKKGDRFAAMGAVVEVLRAGAKWADIEVRQTGGATWRKRQPLPLPSDWRRLAPRGLRPAHVASMFSTLGPVERHRAVLPHRLPRRVTRRRTTRPGLSSRSRRHGCRCLSRLPVPVQSL